MFRDTIASLRASGEGTKTVLIGGFMLGSGALLPIVVVLGHLAKILREPPTGGHSMPVFEAWKAVVMDGGRMIVVWLMYTLVPLGLFVGWLATYSGIAGSLSLPESTPLLVAAPMGTAVGSLLAPLMTIQTLSDQILALGLGEFVYPPYNLLPLATFDLFSLLTALYAVSLVASLYVIPVALTNVARERSLRAGFDYHRLAPVLGSRRYLTGWLVSVLGWTIAMGIQEFWLVWRLASPGRDVYLMSIGPLPVVAIPTQVGILSSALTLIGAFAAFYSLIAGYTIIGRAWNAVHEPVTEQPSASTSIPQSRK